MFNNCSGLTNHFPYSKYPPTTNVLHWNVLVLMFLRSLQFKTYSLTFFLFFLVKIWLARFSAWIPFARIRHFWVCFCVFVSSPEQIRMGSGWDSRHRLPIAIGARVGQVLHFLNCSSKDHAPPKWSSSQDLVLAISTPEKNTYINIQKGIVYTILFFFIRFITFKHPYFLNILTQVRLKAAAIYWKRVYLLED